MKKFRYAVISSMLAVSVSLTACSSGESGEEALPSEPSSSDDNTSADSTENEDEGADDTVNTGDVETSVEATGDEDVVLEFWIHQTGEDETNVYIERIDDFNEAHEDIHVEAEVIIDDGASAYSDSINAALVAGNLPDVMAVDGPYVASFADAGVIQPIDEFVDEETKEQYVDSIIEQGTYQNELYSLGAMEASVMLYYNKDILEEEGIEPASSLEDAWTWDELMNNANQLTTDDRYGLNLFMDYDVGEWLTFMGAPLIWSNGGELISEDGTVVDGHLNSSENIESFEYIASLFEDGVVSESPGQTQFEEGKAALALGGPWIAVSAEDAEMNWGMMPYPYVGEKVSPSGSMAYAVTSITDHPQEAAELMKWMTNEESSIAVAEATGMPPAQASAFEKMEKFNEKPWSIMKEQVTETAKARPSTPAYPVLTDAFAQIFHAAALGEDVEKVAEQQVSRVERELRKFD
ncbi:ABC transporter substrate-binding protein [Alteribacillus bidgolensis]|uniref:Carbohydrate ABC transporter substrate-binding protein, CUT1 family n=1 Tax=Alteribacillus bidgolensis TaxID=930129 RepID=A0A1G8MHR3_9BACI|nr:sugar ABC transporter substrate-binding protein [Alteribacillus bidgolensis]SDI67446.1 carbohydrate ABC transporter substrate-binding protein, CUT1 family [Alteribacillus bidgolensis]